MFSIFLNFLGHHQDQQDGAAIKQQQTRTNTHWGIKQLKPNYGEKNYLVLSSFHLKTHSATLTYNIIT